MGLYTFGIGHLRELVQLVPGLGGLVVVRKRGCSLAFEAVQRLARSLIQWVRRCDGLAVGVVAQGGGLALAALDGRDAVQVVDDAGRDQGDVAVLVFDFFADAVAHGVQGVLDAAASVVDGTGQALGCVEAVRHLEAVGQACALQLARCRVAVGRGFAALGLGEQASAWVVGVGDYSLFQFRYEPGAA